MKTVLITGVSSGIGAASARLFKESGWQVFGVDLIAEDSTLSVVDKLWQGNVADEKLWVDIAKSAELENGLNALVNNAATQLKASLVETTVEDWDRSINVNLKAAFLGMKYLSALLDVAKGSVVNVSSVHAVATSRNIAAYAASKGGLVSLTKAAALEFSENQVRVNTVLPGATDTQMLEDGLDRSAAVDNDLNLSKKDLAERTPCGRIARPEEIAKVILFLADGEQSSFVTGQSFVVDGGALAHLSTE